MTLKDLALALLGRDNFLILTHARPDGDTVGSAAALCRALRASGKTAFTAHNEEMTARYEPFFEGLLAPEGFEPQTVVAVDIADTALLPESTRKYAEKIDFCIDHHPSNKGFAEQTFVRGDAGAAGEIIYELCPHLGYSPDKAAFEALYLAAATDTGCFRYSNTTALSHEIAAKAIACGVDFYKINYEFFTKKTHTRFEVERDLLASLRLTADGRAAGGALTRQYIDKLGATDDDLDNLSSIIIGLEGLFCAVIATEKRDGRSKISVRTRAPADASLICAKFGGGGHARAAGCTLDCGAEQALGILLQAVEGNV